MGKPDAKGQTKPPDEEVTPRRTELRFAQEGHAFLLAPAGVASFSAAGREYAVGESGVIEVDASHVAPLLEHGFTEVESIEVEIVDPSPPNDPGALDPSTSAGNQGGGA